MGIYNIIADDLVNNPSHDLIKGGSAPDALHRMYLMEKVDYKEPAVFTTELARQTEGHNKEYSDFVWVDVSDLLTLVQANLTTKNTAKEKQYALKVEEKTIYVHHPLMDMLRQAPVIEWLKSLNNKQPVRRIHTQGSIGCDASTASYSIAAAGAAAAPDTTKKQDKRYPYPPFFDPRAEEQEKIYILMYGGPFLQDSFLP